MSLENELVSPPLVESSEISDSAVPEAKAVGAKVSAEELDQQPSTLSADSAEPPSAPDAASTHATDEAAAEAAGASTAAKLTPMGMFKSMIRSKGGNTVIVGGNQKKTKEEPRKKEKGEADTDIDDKDEVDKNKDDKLKQKPVPKDKKVKDPKKTLA